MKPIYTPHTICSPYEVQYGDFVFRVTDLERNKMELASGPRYGSLPDGIECNGEVYELIPSEEEDENSFKWAKYLIFK